MAMLLLQGIQDVLQQQWESGRQGSKSLRHLGMKEEEALSGAGGRQSGDSGSAREDGVVRTTVGRKEKVKKNS